MQTETVGGITWSYAIADGCATVTSWNMQTAIPPQTSGAVEVPSTLGGCPVRTIGSYAFFQMGGITSLAIPEGVETIEFYMCRGCTGLKTVSLPSTLKTLGNGVFSGCTNLLACAIPDSVTAMGYETFWGCKSMTSVRFSENVKTLDSMTCYDCDSLEVCEKGFYTPSNDGASAGKAQALYIRAHGKKAFLAMHDRLHEKYDFAKTQEILGQDVAEALRIMEAAGSEAGK